MARADVRGRAAIPKWSPEVQKALLDLKLALAREPHVKHAQVTMDDVRSMDTPPTLDLVCTEILETEVNRYVDGRFTTVNVMINWTNNG